MMLILLSKSKNVNTDFLYKVIKDRIYKTYTRSIFRYSPPLLSLLAPVALAILAVSVVSIAYFLVAITGVEIAKTDTSFLTFFGGFKDTY